MGEGTDRIKRLALAQGVPEDATMVQALIIQKLDSVIDQQKTTHERVTQIGYDVAEMRTKIALIEQKQDDQDSDIRDNTLEIRGTRSRMQEQIEDIKKSTRFMPAMVLVFTGLLTAFGAWLWSKITSLPPSGTP